MTNNQQSIDNGLLLRQMKAQTMIGVFGVFVVIAGWAGAYYVSQFRIDANEQRTAAVIMKVDEMYIKQSDLKESVGRIDERTLEIKRRIDMFQK